MSTHASEPEERIDQRTRRACEEAMTVFPHGGGSGMFDVYSESGSEYVVDLRDEVCSCPDYTHREPADSCKHVRRVRIELGVADVPNGLRSEHAAPLDVELARRRRGIDDGQSPDRDESPASISVEKQAAQAVKAMTDGGEVIQPNGGRDVTERRLLANEIACQLVAIDGVQDFEPFCALVAEIQDDIIRAWNEEERRQAKSAPARQLVIE